VLEAAEQEIKSIRELLKSPTPENFEAVNQKLGCVAAALEGMITEPSIIKTRSASDTVFLSKLSSEMECVRLLLETPIKLLEGLSHFRMQRFGSYNAQGQVKGFDLQTSQTLTHL
jgi:hypothetical protein